MQQIRAEANAQGYAITYGKSATDSNTTASELINNLQDFSENAHFAVTRAETDLANAQAQIKEYEDSTLKAGNALNSV